MAGGKRDLIILLAIAVLVGIYVVTTPSPVARTVSFVCQILVILMVIRSGAARRRQRKVPPAETTPGPADPVSEPLPAGAVEIAVPPLGDVRSAVLDRWLKRVGEEVREGEPLYEVSTDKVDTEIPSPARGFLHSINAYEGQAVEIGARIGVIVPARPAAQRETVKNEQPDG